MTATRYQHATYLLGWLIIVLTSCTASDPLRAQRLAQLKQARQQWTTQHITHYRFTVEKLCFCDTQSIQPITIEVRDGQPISGVRAAPAAEFDGALLAHYGTIEQLFAIIEENINYYPDEMMIRYDLSKGYPINITIDRDKDAADDESFYTVTDFEVLP